MGQCLLMFAKLLFSFSLNFVQWRVKLSPCVCYHQMWIFVFYVFEFQTQEEGFDIQELLNYIHQYMYVLLLDCDFRI